MSEVKVSDFLEGYDDAPSDDHGFVNRPIPKGQYPLKFSKLVDTRFTRNGVPEAVFRAEVVDGPAKEDGFLYSMYLGASRTKVVENADGSLAKDSQGQLVREEISEEEFRKKVRGAQGKIKTLRTNVFKLPASVTPSVPQTDPAYIFQFYGIADLVGREFMSDVIVDKDGRNKIMNFFPLDHKEFGMSMWREKELPRQERASKGKGASVSKAAEI